MISPGDTYAMLARASARGTLLTAVRRPLIVALVLGVSVAKAATGHVTPALVASTTLCWSFVVVLQGTIAVGLMAGAARRTVGMARAIDLYFAGHAPWSLWILAAAAWSPSPLGRPMMPLLIAGVVPLVLTARITNAFFREVLALDPRHALVRTAVHQAVTWGCLVVLFGTAVALMPRIVEWVS